MKSTPFAPLALILHATFCVPALLFASIPTPQPVSKTAPPVAAVWQSTQAEHVYGFPEIKHNKKGTLTLSTDTLTFTGKSGIASVPRLSVTAVSAGNQRVEIWGLGGRILRMTIPNGGGLAAASVMHHRIDMLTVEYNDGRGGTHSAVFFLPANEADQALHNFALTPPAAHGESSIVCQDAPIEPKSVLVSAPNWDQAQVPAAYRALVYEHLVDRLRNTKDVGHVYREGETGGQRSCPQYTIHIAIKAFKEGSSVKRSFMGPVGMFVGTTQMKFDVNYTDASGTIKNSEQIAATMRGESESTNVADHVAKNVAKHYTNLLKKSEKSPSPAKSSEPTL
ncbi:MAG: hypothetical protein JWM43_4158 [Acidobacteriaceae bacterium]|nr:hypothetical protein [Acidobacteriaceae bacterium]